HPHDVPVGGVQHRLLDGIVQVWVDAGADDRRALPRLHLPPGLRGRGPPRRRVAPGGPPPRPPAPPPRPPPGTAPAPGGESPTWRTTRLISIPQMLASAKPPPQPGVRARR